jgi:protein ImuA
MDRQRQFYPPAAVAWGVNCGQLLIVQPTDAADEMWALDQALRCPAVAAVWAPLGKLDSRQYRRLQLAAEEGRTLGLLVRSTRYRGEPTWADVQLVVEPLARGPGFFFAAAHQAASTQLREKETRPLSRRLRVVVVRCPGGAAERGVELRIEDFTAAITAAEPTSGQRQETPHETPARAPLSAVGFATGYGRPPGA